AESDYRKHFRIQTENSSHSTSQAFKHFSGLKRHQRITQDMSTSVNLTDNLLAFCIDQANPQNVAVAGGEPLPHTGATVVSVILAMKAASNHRRASCTSAMIILLAVSRARPELICMTASE